MKITNCLIVIICCTLSACVGTSKKTEKIENNQSKVVTKIVEIADNKAEPKLSKENISPNITKPLIESKPACAVIKPRVITNNQNITGWLEYAKLTDSTLVVKAKLDSGAKTSSIDAKIIKTIKENNKKYVLYRLSVEGHENKIFKSKINRWVRIKKKEGGYVRRPVIDMEICIGGKKITGEVNLSSREHFVYRLLIGRNMLKNNFIVDSSKTYLKNQPSCK